MAAAAIVPWNDVREREYTQRDIINLMAESGVFAGLGDADLQLFLRSLQVLNFAPMDQVIGEGAYSAALYIVIAGRFMVVRSGTLENKHLRGGELRELDTFARGHCFGEYSLLDRQSASASVVAAESAQALKIPRRDFESVLMSDYRIAKTVYQNLACLLTARLRKSLKV